MTRVYSAARMKGTARVSTPRTLPHAGTRLRKYWDQFQSRRGQVIAIRGDGRFKHDVMRQLRDYYGLDIRRMRHHHWCLCGEWIDGDYVDYVAQAYNSNQQQEIELSAQLYCLKCATLIKETFCDDSFALCIACGHIMKLDHRKQLRNPNRMELHELASGRRHQMVTQAITKIRMGAKEGNGANKE